MNTFKLHVMKMWWEPDTDEPSVHVLLQPARDSTLKVVNGQDIILTLTRDDAAQWRVGETVCAWFRTEGITPP